MFSKPAIPRNSSVCLLHYGVVLCIGWAWRLGTLCASRGGFFIFFISRLAVWRPAIVMLISGQLTCRECGFDLCRVFVECLHRAWPTLTRSSTLVPARWYERAWIADEANVKLNMKKWEKTCAIQWVWLGFVHLASYYFLIVYCGWIKYTVNIYRILSSGDCSPLHSNSTVYPCFHDTGIIMKTKESTYYLLYYFL